jgi:hypothetical protein
MVVMAVQPNHQLTLGKIPKCLRIVVCSQPQTYKEGSV